MSSFSHLKENGSLQMVDVSSKTVTERKAIAKAEVIFPPEIYPQILSQNIPKGDFLACAKVAGILAAKKTSELIPLCHPLPISHVDISFRFIPENFSLEITSEVTAVAQTGVEMEALTSVSIAALTVYDMCKSLHKGIKIDKIRLVYKKGGKSGDFEEKGGFMEKEKLEFFKNLLLERREQIIKEALETKKELIEGTEPMPDVVDLASRESNLTFELRLRDRERKLLRKIEKALQKIEEGTYGICEICGSEIDEKRLTARPEATLCIDCKRAQERMEKIRGE